MTVTIRKALGGKEDLKFYTAASPTFQRTTSSGGSTTVTAISATHIPLVQASASLYFSANNLQRAANELVSRYFGVQHSTATYGGGGRVGHHVDVFGYRNAFAATSIQAAASNAFLRDGIARIVLPAGTTTAATPIQLPRRCVLVGNGMGSIVRASSTIQTSRVFSISGSSGATSQALGGAVSAGATQLSVSNGAQFANNVWINVQSGLTNEEHQVRSVAGNNLNIFDAFRAAITTATVKVIYPAEVYLDNFELQLSSATQGIGIAATYMVQSLLGAGLKIKGAAVAAVQARRSDQNLFQAQLLNTKSFTKGYGVWLREGSGFNKVSGLRQYIRKDVADSVSLQNTIDIQQTRVGNVPSAVGGIASASLMTDLFPRASTFYRHNKPSLSYTSYSVSGTATNVVACTASSDAPAEVYINGQIYRNTGTTLCDLSRTKTPATATIGGLDRGPATATRSYYIYAVPTQTPTATRQFDLVASTTSHATGPTASATYPQWSCLGAVNTAATVRLVRFVQNGDKISMWDSNFDLVTLTSAISAQATWKQSRAARIPVGARSIDVFGQIVWNSTAIDAAANGFSVVLSHGDALGLAHSYDSLDLTRSNDGGSSAALRPIDSQLIPNLPVNSNRFFAYRIPTAGTANFNLLLKGFVLPRASFK